MRVRKARRYWVSRRTLRASLDAALAENARLREDLRILRGPETAWSPSVFPPHLRRVYGTPRLSEEDLLQHQPRIMDVIRAEQEREMREGLLRRDALRREAFPSDHGDPPSPRNPRFPISG